MDKKQYLSPIIAAAVLGGADALLIGSPHGTLETPSEDDIEIELL